ncbi:MAG: disulfide oxidoreductase [Thermoflexales bacterium]|nr:disulfide oxidoreductase [Thermoflexales bacterium]
MTHAQPSSIVEASNRGALARWGIYTALAAAWVATAGSLYMSEVLGWVPCLWCWYQRIAMYPLALLLAFGLIVRDRSLPKYALMLAVPGLLAATYHILLQKVPFFARFEACRVGVPCSVDYLNWLGFITVPMLAWVAFAIVIAGSILALRAGADGAYLQAGPVLELSPTLSVGLVVIPVVLLFTLSGVLSGSQRTAEAQPSLEALSTTPSLERASDQEALRIYNQSCIGCHGPANAGMILVRPEFLRENSDLELLAFMRAGRAANAPDNFSGQAMPANGGRIDLTDAQILALIRLMREAKQ